MSHEAVDGTASELGELIDNGYAPQASSGESVGSGDSQTAHTDNLFRRNGTHNGKDSIPQFLHWVQKEPHVEAQQSNPPLQQQPFAAPTGYPYGYPYYPYPYPPQPVSASVTGNAAYSDIPTGYGSMHPAYSQQQQQHYNAAGQQPYATEVSPFFPTPPHQFVDHTESSTGANAHVYYNNPYSSMVHPMMWSQGSSGARPPTVPSSRKPSSNKSHRRVRSSSPVATDAKVAEYDQLRVSHLYQHGGVEQGMTPFERQPYPAEDMNRRRTASTDRNGMEYEVPLAGDDYNENVPFLGKYRDGTSYESTPRNSLTAEDALHHRRVRSEEPTVGTSLVRFKDDGYGATSNQNIPSNAPPSTPSAPSAVVPATKQQHPLLRKPRRASAPLVRPSLERNQSCEDLPRHALKRPVHRRVSSESGLPPAGPRVGRHHRRNSSRGSTGLAEHVPRSRTDSASSVVSYASTVSVVTDISRSALFGGITESGLVQFHLPMDNINLVMNPDLTPGTILKHREEDEEERFLEYHMVTSGEASWQDVLDEEGPCTCACDNCIHCTAKARLLPTVRYAMVVEDDVYRRILKEVSDSKWMPCGLFFCGHHEDVRHPSIFIAVFIVGFFLLGMLVVAFCPI